MSKLAQAIWHGPRAIVEGQIADGPSPAEAGFVPRRRADHETRWVSMGRLSENSIAEHTIRPERFLLLQPLPQDHS